MLNPEDRRISKSKTAMRNALIQLIEEKEFNKITVTDIVERADLNRGTFYKHYKSQTDILLELTEDIMEDLIQSYRMPYKEQRIFNLDNLTASTVKIFEHVEKFQGFYALMLRTDKLTYFQTQIFKVLKGLTIHDLMKIKKEANQPDQALQASFFANAIIGMISEWAENNFSYSTYYMAEQLLLILKSMRQVQIIHPRLE
ncbi:TetR/AcrR family transcriptional regulator [Oceanobacillus sojae]|uniref:TetR/AcrR family transcriptional regulator n=1 Tax=Oceanobacillus sojae TaxID=582851 RepID=UPI00158A2D9F|nr:TetR/AcrR family transcriptional regulator [Oceanobacillus sojae]MCT1902647.1 TetR/AcrR family transcriptional regulator [Oceanobacillus sojae]